MKECCDSITGISVIATKSHIWRMLIRFLLNSAKWGRSNRRDHLRRFYPEKAILCLREDYHGDGHTITVERYP